MSVKKSQIYCHIQRFNNNSTLFFFNLFLVLFMFVEMETFISSHTYSNTWQFTRDKV